MFGYESCIRIGYKDKHDAYLFDIHIKIDLEPHERAAIIEDPGAFASLVLTPMLVKAIEKHNRESVNEAIGAVLR